RRRHTRWPRDWSSDVCSSDLEDTRRSYDFSQRLAGEMIDADWETLAARIDTRGEGVPIVVFNPLGWPRTDVVEVEVGFGERGVLDMSLADPAGKAEGLQILQADRDRDGGITRARILFIAQDVPAIGYATYRIIPQRSAATASKETVEDKERTFIENESYRAAFDLANGAMTSLFDKSEQWEVLAGPANVVA